MEKGQVLSKDRKWITGSNAAVVIGHSKRATPRALFDYILMLRNGKVQPNDPTPWGDFGHRMEEATKMIYCIISGDKVEPGNCWIHKNPKYAHKYSVSPDGLVVENDPIKTPIVGLECKSHKEWCDEKMDYTVQCYHQMFIIPSLKRVELFQVLYDRDVEIAPVRIRWIRYIRNQSFIDFLERQYARFTAYIEAGFVKSGANLPKDYDIQRIIPDRFITSYDMLYYPDIKAKVAKILGNNPTIYEAKEKLLRAKNDMEKDDFIKSLFGTPFNKQLEEMAKDTGSYYRTINDIVDEYPIVRTLYHGDCDQFRNWKPTEDTPNEDAQPPNKKQCVTKLNQ